jgi:ABC-2 type transport system ATP-binding protein
VIEVEDLKKHYFVHQRAPGVSAALRSLWKREKKLVPAVDGISLRIAPGERVGFLGPNGAGKTTTLKVLSGLLHPTSGRVVVNGFEPAKRQDAFLRSIMLVAGQKQQLLWDLPPSDTFELNRAIYGIPSAQFKDTLDELITLLELQDLIGKPTRQLSLGERMKCELAASLLHRPKVLFLDEPTIGLDVTMQVVVREFIRSYNQRHGATVILTSHDMDDVAALCDRVIVISGGKLIYEGRLAQLVQTIRPEKRLSVELSAPVSVDLDTYGRVVERSERRVVWQIDKSVLGPSIERVLRELPVADLTVESAPLEEVLSDLFKRRGAGEVRAA